MVTVTILHRRYLPTYVLSKSNTSSDSHSTSTLIRNVRPGPHGGTIFRTNVRSKISLSDPINFTRTGERHSVDLHYGNRAYVEEGRNGMPAYSARLSWKHIKRI